MILDRRKKSAAFTLVELMAAMALSTLLVLAILAVFPSIAATRKQVAAVGESTARTVDEVFELIRWDLTQAHRMKLQAGQLVLAGFGSLDSRTLEPTHRPVRVVYRVRLRGNEPWLVREQTNLDVRSNRNVDVAPVERLASIRFVARQKVRSASDAGTPTTKPSTRPARQDFFGIAEGLPLPDGIDVSLQAAEPGAAAIEKTLYIR